MQVAEVKTRIIALSDRLSQLGVESLSLFGSAARGEATPDSDLDFLVDFREQATFARYMDLKELLEENFGRPIDLVTKKALKPLMREQVLREAIRVA